MRLLQGILLYSNGEIRQTGYQRRREERRRSAREWRLRDLQSTKPSLQSQQPH